MLETGIRQAATVLLESAIRIAPPSAQEWGMAMRGELSQVESPWDGTLWALGGTTVLVKETLVSLVVPNSLVPDGGLFARSPALRRAATVIGAAGVLSPRCFSLLLLPIARHSESGSAPGSACFTPFPLIRRVRFKLLRGKPPFGTMPKDSHSPQFAPRTRRRACVWRKPR